MKVLGIETATLAGGVALLEENRLIAEYRLHVEIRHSERLMLAIDHILKESGTSLSDLDGIAVSAGPGSFTGLRVGLATAKGLGVGSGKPLLLVPTLEAMAVSFPYCRALIMPCLHSRRGEVYWSLFRYGRGLEVIHPDSATSIEAALDLIAGFNEDILFVGEGALNQQTLILDRCGGRAFFPPPALQFPSAAAVAQQGLLRLVRGEQVPPEEAAPFYLRASQAELKWKTGPGRISPV